MCSSFPLLSISTLQNLNTFSCQFIGLRRVVCFFSPAEKLYRALSRELRLCNHCPVSASAFLCLCFLLVLELTASQWRMGFEPEGSSLYQRLIATSEHGTAPKQTFTAVKRGSAPNDVGQQGFFFFLLHSLYGDGCQRWTNIRTLAVSNTTRGQISPYFNSCLLVERKSLIKEKALIFCGPCALVSQPRLTTMNHRRTDSGQRWTALHLRNCSTYSHLHVPADGIIKLRCNGCLAVFTAYPQYCICQRSEYIRWGRCHVMLWYFGQNNQFIQQGFIWRQHRGSFSARGCALPASTCSHL